MRILVTGATGYVGRPLTERLLRDGHEVVALVRSASRAEDLAKLGAQLCVADINDIEAVFPPATQAVVHTAFTLFPNADQRTNVDGSQRLIRAAEAAGVKKFIYTSSSLVYGPSDPAGSVDERHACHPHTVFAKQQRRVEELLFARARASGFPSIILRPSEIWGGEGGFFNSTVDRLRRGQFFLADAGEQQLSFTERSDLLEVIARCLVVPMAPAEVLNVGTPVGVNVAALYDGLADAAGVRRPRRLPGELIWLLGALAKLYAGVVGRPAAFDLDIARLARFRAGTRRIDKARELIGFEPAHSDPLRAILAHFAGAIRS